MAAPAIASGAADAGRTGATVKTVLWMSGALLCFIVMALGGREVTKVVSPIEVMMFRALIATVVVLFILGVTGQGFGVLKTNRILTISAATVSSSAAR